MLKLFIKSWHQRRIIPHASWSMLEHAATSMHTQHTLTHTHTQPHEEQIYTDFKFQTHRQMNIKALGSIPPDNNAV